MICKVGCSIVLAQFECSTLQRQVKGSGLALQAGVRLTLCDGSHWVIPLLQMRPCMSKLRDGTPLAKT